MAFLGITTFNWVLIVLIIVFLLIIIRNISQLMKRRNEYLSLKEAQEQHTPEHGERLSSDENGVDAQSDDKNEE